MPTNNNINNYIDNWDLLFFKMANLVARKSKDPSSQVGSVIVRDKTILSTGFNGFCIGVKDFPDRYNDRELKYKLVAHSEFNACIVAARLGVLLKGGTLYTQSTPCNECAKAIIQSGIKYVNILKNCEEIWAKYENWANSCQITKMMFGESGVEVQEFDVVCGDTILIGGKEYNI